MTKDIEHINLTESIGCPVCGYDDCRRYIGSIAKRIDRSRELVIAGCICPKCTAYIQTLISDYPGELQSLQLQNLYDAWLKKGPAPTEAVCHVFEPIRLEEAYNYAKEHGCSLEEATGWLYKLREDAGDNKISCFE